MARVDAGRDVALLVRPVYWSTPLFVALDFLYGESVVNIALLVLSTGAAYLGVLETAASPDVVIASPFTPQAVASLALSASVLAASYTLSSASLIATRGAR